MILQSLNEYYNRKESELPPFGFEEKAIPFLIIIDKEGRFIHLERTGEIEDKRIQPQSFEVPQGKGRSGAKSYETAYLLWDHYGYVLNQPKLDKPDAQPNKKAIDDAEKQHQSFKTQIQQLHTDLPDDEGVAAVYHFLKSAEQIDKVKQHEYWLECLKIKGCNMAFKLASEDYLVCQSPGVVDWVKSQPLPDEDTAEGLCLVTGEKASIVRLHDAISGVAQKPAPLAAINDSAYCSYGKNKAFNFPVSVDASFKYATALNHLLRKGSPNKFRLLDTTFVCWAEKTSPLAHLLPAFLTDDGDDPDKSVGMITALFNTVFNGTYQEDDATERFYLLGLSPNSARIVIRFWYVGTVAEFSENIAQWFRDLDIDGRDKFGYPMFKKLLRATALQYKDDNVSPNLPTELLRAILNNSPLPETYIQSLIRRIKAEQGHITFNRVSGLKAYLTRRYRLNQQRELTVSLDKENTEIGYCLGRLFAVLEKLQKDAQPGINATIKDRYYSSASCTPRSVFGTLIRLSNHHLKKLEQPSWRVNAEKRIGEVMELIPAFPSHLNLEQQALFAVGYYHQKQDFYKTKTEPEKESTHELAE